MYVCVFVWVCARDSVESKRIGEEMMQRIKAAFLTEIADLPWLDAPTRKRCVFTIRMIITLSNILSRGCRCSRCLCVAVCFQTPVPRGLRTPVPRGLRTPVLRGLFSGVSSQTPPATPPPPANLQLRLLQRQAPEREREKRERERRESKRKRARARERERKRERVSE